MKEKITPPVRLSVLVFLFLLGCTLIFTSKYLVGMCTIVGESMSPTMHTGHISLVAWCDKMPEEGDIVVVQSPDRPGILLCKRVVAINITGEHVTRHLEDAGLVVIPPQHIYVMGDNRKNSHDSRAFGPLPLSSVAGVVLTWF